MAWLAIKFYEKWCFICLIKLTTTENISKSSFVEFWVYFNVNNSIFEQKNYEIFEYFDFEIKTLHFNKMKWNLKM